MHLTNISKLFLAGAVVIAFTVAAPCQTTLFVPGFLAAESSSPKTSNFDASAFRMDFDSGDDQGSTSTAHPKQHEGFMKRVLKRGLEDQKGLYAAPFKPSNIKWDVVVLAGTGAFLATDRRIETHVSHSNFNVYQNISNASLAGLSASLAGVWLYGLKTDNPHAKETGELAVETLANTFLFYAPMQFIAGRERPDEGNGKGDFLKHHAMNSSFPAGHAMFTFAMASVVAHEYPKLWVQVLAYGAATTVAFSRARARDHWASDTFVGGALGLAIGTHIFHSRCDPELSSSCHHRTRKWQP
jgi:hypothetical protein